MRKYHSQHAALSARDDRPRDGIERRVHAGNGKAGYAMAELGFQMITLASESQALRRGAAAGLDEARGDR
jgi:4-hydroxy-2-oxoheptanedioate aldolase